MFLKSYTASWVKLRVATAPHAVSLEYVSRDSEVRAAGERTEAIGMSLELHISTSGFHL